MKIALAQNDSQFLHDSLKNLKSHYVFIGVLMIIGIILTAISVILMMFGAAALGTSF